MGVYLQTFYNQVSLTRNEQEPKNWDISRPVCHILTYSSYFFYVFLDWVLCNFVTIVFYDSRDFKDEAEAVSD